MYPNRCYFESRKSGHVNATNRPSFPYLLVAVVCLLSGLLIRNGFVNGRLRSRYSQIDILIYNPRLSNIYKPVVCVCINL